MSGGRRSGGCYGGGARPKKKRRVSTKKRGSSLSGGVGRPYFKVGGEKVRGRKAHYKSKRTAARARGSWPMFIKRELSGDFGRQFFEQSNAEKSATMKMLYRQWASGARGRIAARRAQSLARSVGRAPRARLPAGANLFGNFR